MTEDLCADADVDSGLLHISISDSEDEDENQTSGENIKDKTPQKSRTAQTEDDFALLKTQYQAKIENGEIWKTIRLPLGPTMSKQETQALLHAVEELYFFRRYSEANLLVRKILDDRQGTAGLDKDVANLLELYGKKCLDKMTTVG